MELRHGEVLVARFLVNPRPVRPHFDVLATPDGRNLVWVGPPDHVWHYGHWFSWKMINDVNFWETDPNTGESAGRYDVDEVKMETAADHAVVRFRGLARLPGIDSPVLEDRVEIRITPKPDGPQVDWSFTTTALADVILGRTPLPGEPNGVPWGGYGGLSWRGAKDLKDVRFLDSEGRSGMDIHRQHARWADARGTLGDKPAGLAMIDHPANPRHPTSWFIVAEPPIPFWYLNPALVQPKPVELAKGNSFTHRYRVLIHDGTWTPQRLNDEAAAFAR